MHRKVAHALEGVHGRLDSPAFRSAGAVRRDGPALAQQADPITAIRADRWADAQRAAATYADPVAIKLVTYYRLLAPGAATADEITDFMAQSPDWPNQALLERRRQEAIATDPDLASTLAQCERNKLTVPPDDAALRRGAGECRPQRRGGRGRAPRLDAGIGDRDRPSSAAGQALCGADDHGSGFSALPGTIPRRPRDRLHALDPPHIAPRPRRGWRCSATRRMRRRGSPACRPRCGATLA